MGVRLCICGPGRSGKDTVAEWFGKNTSLKYVGGTSWFAADELYQYMNANGYSYRTVLECWQDRLNHRKLWADYINNVINRPDRTALYKRCLMNQDILTGVRHINEIEACQQEFQMLTIWVKRNVEHDLTMEFTADFCDIIITNNESLERLYEKCTNLARALGCLTAT